MVSFLEHDEVASHPYVIEELALGSMRQREVVLELLEQLVMLPVVSHTELMVMVERQQLWSRGLSAVDAHLLASVTIVPGTSLWTRDTRLARECRDSGVDVIRE